MKTTVLIYCALACAAFGQWSTNVWPSYAYPRQSVPQIQEVHSAAVERCYAAGVSIAGLRLYRSQYDNLTNIKARLKAAVPAYIVTNGMEGDLSGYIESNGIPYYTVTGLLYSVKMPINFFDYTPWSNLSGVGPLTNSGYEWGNGWTNGWTKAGGTNYPPGRTNWYTTDYGYMMITNIFPPLVWTEAQLWYDFAAMHGLGYSALTNDVDAWAESKSNAIADFSPAEPVDYWWNAASRLVKFNSANRQAELYSVYGEISPYIPIGYPSNIICDADFYARATAADWLYSGCTFTNFGDARISETVVRFFQTNNAPAGSIYADFGQSNYPSAWPAEPVGDGEFNSIGYEVADQYSYDRPWIVLKFDGTNGFKYR